MTRTVSIGCQDFETIRSNDYLYIDKKIPRPSGKLPCHFPEFREGQRELFFKQPKENMPNHHRFI